MATATTNRAPTSTRKPVRKPRLAAKAGSNNPTQKSAEAEQLELLKLLDLIREKVRAILRQPHEVRAGWHTSDLTALDYQLASFEGLLEGNASNAVSLAYMVEVKNDPFFKVVQLHRAGKVASEELRAAAAESVGEYFPK